jgi:hypothetical protein
MAGTKAGALTSRKKYGDDYHKRIGKLGGTALHLKPIGFATLSKERVMELGMKGGLHGRRKETEATDTR